MEWLQVKSADSLTRGRREASCRKVLEHLDLQLLELDLFCFVDDEITEDADFEERKNSILGVANRGVFVHNVAHALRDGIPPLPSYVRPHLCNAAGDALFERLIYVHGSACEPEVSLIITLSHELQHFLQRRNEPQASEADSRLRGLLQNWQEHPSEHEAMLVSKQVATRCCGEELVSHYTEARIESARKNVQHGQEDQLRWEFFRDLRISSKYSFQKEVARLVEKHR